jgi:hypothetical protein
MVKNIGEGHLLPEMKDCVVKVQNLVTETDGEAWATAFAEVSFHETKPYSLDQIDNSLESRSASKYSEMGYRQPAVLESRLQAHLHYGHNSLGHAVRVPGSGKCS